MCASRLGKHFFSFWSRQSKTKTSPFFSRERKEVDIDKIERQALVFFSFDNTSIEFARCTDSLN
jgi:hypothetical protein